MAGPAEEYQGAAPGCALMSIASLTNNKNRVGGLGLYTTNSQRRTIARPNWPVALTGQPS